MTNQKYSKPSECPSARQVDAKFMTALDEFDEWVKERQADLEARQQREQLRLNAELEQRRSAIWGDIFESVGLPRDEKASYAVAKEGELAYLMSTEEAQHIDVGCQCPNCALKRTMEAVESGELDIAMVPFDRLLGSLFGGDQRQKPGKPGKKGPNDPELH